METAVEPYVRVPSLEEAEAIAELQNAWALAREGVKATSAESIRTSWQMPDLVKTGHRLGIYTPQDQLVGYGWLYATVPFTQFSGMAYVHPDFEGQGIGTRLLTFIEETAHQMIDQSDQQVILHQRVASEQQPALDFLSRHGYEVIRHFWHMQIDFDAPLPDPDWAEGITVRHVDPEHDLPALHILGNQIFADHWGHMPFTLEHWQYWYQHKHFDPSVSYVVFQNDEMIAFCNNTPHKSDNAALGWIGSLGVRRDWRKHGLGMALLRQSFQAFYAMGKQQVGLRVDAGSLTGATRLYESAGMRVVKQYDVYEKVLRPGTKGGDSHG